CSITCDWSSQRSRFNARQINLSRWRVCFSFRSLFFSQRSIDGSTQGDWVQRSRGNGLVIDEDSWCIFNSERFTSVLIGLNLFFHFLATHVLLEAIQVQAKHPGIRSK